MKILFAVSNENIAEAIKKQYQSSYKGMLTTKNVYYFNAIIKELQNDKTYDVVIISEDLEPFANNNYDAVDKFLIGKLSDIREESKKLDGTNLPIIFITTDRHVAGDNLLSRLFEIGIYNALFGESRSVRKVCELIAKPRNKERAKEDYKIVNDAQPEESDDNVKEAEIKNIIAHYKKLGKSEERYVESFDNIAAQYTDAQLKVIIRFLPLNVKAVLEEQSPKYQELMTFNQPSRKSSSNQRQLGKIREKERKLEQQQDVLLEQLSDMKTDSPIVIPKAINTKTVRKATINPIEEFDEIESTPSNETEILPGFDDFEDEEQDFQEEPETLEPVRNGRGRPKKIQPVEDIEEEPVVPAEPKRRGRPKKVQLVEDIEDEVVPVAPKKRGRPKKIQPVGDIEDEPIVPAEPKRRGRPKKVQLVEEVEEEPVVPVEPKRRGRPKKIQPVEEVDDDEQMLPGLGFDDDDDDEYDDEQTLPGVEFDEDEEIVDEDDEQVLPGLGFDDDDEEEDEVDDDDEQMLPGLDDETGDEEEEFVPRINRETPRYTPLSEEDFEEEEERPRPSYQNKFDRELIKPNANEYQYENIERLVSRDRKIVSFIGTGKNGTSFIVNNVAQILSEMGINTAILDMTKNRNSYYIYTQNDENLRQRAHTSIDKLREGVIEGIVVNKNLTVYTATPTDSERYEESDLVLKTLIQNYALVLIDCDFNTPVGYFDNSQEIYLVQGMDILTIQPLTAFLRDLKTRGILKQEKIRVVINMYERVKGLNDKVIVGGIAYYNDPSMSFMTELFDKNSVPTCIIPFDLNVYTKYLGALVDCEVSLAGYPKQFIARLKELANMIYPLIANPSRSSYTPPSLSKFQGAMPFGKRNNEE